MPGSLPESSSMPPPSSAVLIKDSRSRLAQLAELVAVQMSVQSTIAHNKPLACIFTGLQVVANRQVVWLNQ